MTRPVLLALLVPTLAVAAEPLTIFDDLLGTWVNDSAPAEGTGSFSLAKDLGGSVLVRRNHADLPATADRPATKHDDLMVIYVSGGVVKAHFFDNEGHDITYTATEAADHQSLVLLSDGPGPKFKLVYAREPNHQWLVRFSMAMPNAPENFRTLFSGKVHRAK